MRLTYDFIIQKFNDLANFVSNCEAAINKNQNDYQIKLQALDDYLCSESNRLRSESEQNKKVLIQKADSMLDEALKISGAINQIENTLMSKDKYYRKTKKNKEEELREKTNNGYDGEDYFQILDTICVDFDRISLKYREKILPGIINGIHYFFSSKRKADYEELIILQNTVAVFISEIKDNLSTFRDDALQKIEKSYQHEQQKLRLKFETEKTRAESEHEESVTELTEVISESLDVVFPDELVDEMSNAISEYLDSMHKVTDKRMSSDSFFSLFNAYLPMALVGASGPVYTFITEKLEKLIINTQAGDFLLMPVLGYTDKSSNWYFQWDNTNREFVNQLVCDVMYSVLARVPVGHLTFDIVDPISRGTNIRAYYDARSKIPELFSDRIYFNNTDIDNRLTYFSNYIDYVIQRTLGTRYNSVFEYSDDHEEFIPDVKYLIIFDFPKGMSDASLELLNNIVYQGPKAGVFTVIGETYDEMDAHHTALFTKNLNEIKSRSRYITVTGQKTCIGSQTIAILAQMPERQAFGSYIDRYLLIRESIKNKGLVFPKMIKPLLISDDFDVIKAQIDYIDEFQNNMQNNSCLDVKGDITIPAQIGIGTVQYPVSIFEDSCAYDQIMERYAKFSNFATMPFSIDLDDDLNITLLGEIGEEEKITNYSHNILWSFFSAIPAGAFHACIIDIDGHGKNTVPFIDFCSKRPDIFSGGVLSAHDQTRDKLRELVKLIDAVAFKRLGSKYQNIHEYNKEAQFGIEPLILLVVYDFTRALDTVELTELQKIILNGSRCGIYTLLCGSHLTEDERRDASKAALIDSILKTSTILEPKEEFFKLTPFNVMLEPRKHLAQYQTTNFIEQYINALEIVDEKERNRSPENDYTKLFDLTKAPVYVRGNKKIHLPYGISAEGELYYCDFENENFAAFLCGSSGSGKSTLLHSLITGILMNNHPDDVELWLADFKMKEFRRYVNNRPPHIKYILLEESSDSVYDFLDRMKEKLSERERLSSAYSDFAKAPISQYMPLIFIIIDEFSIMSQIIDENDSYKLILQNLLAKGRALGFRFLFSSQTFTTGITGLTQTAKKQIQMRLAMKCSQEEIAETIDMSKSLMTDEQKRWLLTLPKYYVLLKKLVSEGNTVVGGKVQDEVLLTRAKGLYFSKPEYADQNDYIHMILATYKAVEKYNPSDVNTYKDKKSVVVDGSVYYSIADAQNDIIERQEYIERTDPYASEKTRLFVGRPRSMKKVSEIIVENEFEENLILFGENVELCTSVLMSAMSSLSYKGAVVSVIGYSKNLLCRRLDEVGRYNIDEFCTSEEDICEVIHRTKEAIDQGKTGNMFLFIIGLDVLLKNIELMSKSSGRFRKKKSTVINEFDENLVFSNEPEDVSFEQKLLDEEQQLGIAGGRKENLSTNTRPVQEPIHSVQKKDEELGIFDIRDDLEVILTEGPRLGYHVFIYSRRYDEFKQTRYNLDLFKHRLTFKCSKDDSRNIINNASAFNLGEIAFLYTDMQTSFSMRPYLHEGLKWDGWETDNYGHAIQMTVDANEQVSESRVLRDEEKTI